MPLCFINIYGADTEIRLPSIKSTSTADYNKYSCCNLKTIPDGAICIAYVCHVAMSALVKVHACLPKKHINFVDVKQMCSHCGH